ncbi:MAG: hypothetical protein JXK05_10480 [Campylobacterales bacterium]|nr:hypothetical protein [Campylobacterales bacterium]
MTPSSAPFERFSHLYIERRVLELPQTKRIMARLTGAQVIIIEHYKDLFNRRGQNYDLQERSKKLILAHKEAPYMYEGSFYSDGFGFEHFFYTAGMLGCVYDCDYCYLQGLYNSANIVLFVNTEDFFDALLPYLGRPTLVAISYDTDTLALESLALQSRAWIEFARTQAQLHLEIRTKSANIRAIDDLEPLDRVVLAWTLSPQSVIERYEHDTPSLAARLRAIVRALELGWRVRVCIDPVLDVEGCDALYGALIDELFLHVSPEALYSLTLGTFRMSAQHLRRLKSLRRSDLPFYPYEVREGMALYPLETEQRILSSLHEHAARYLEPQRIRLWQQP